MIDLVLIISVMSKPAERVESWVCWLRTQMGASFLDNSVQAESPSPRRRQGTSGPYL